MTTKFQIDILSAMPVNTKATQFLIVKRKTEWQNGIVKKAA